MPRTPVSASIQRPVHATMYLTLMKEHPTTLHPAYTQHTPSDSNRIGSALTAVVLSRLPYFTPGKANDPYCEMNQSNNDYPGPCLLQPWSGDGESQLKLGRVPQGTV